MAIDTLLAGSVFLAVILMGALISIGNERQRKALDRIREQVEAWSEEDIRIKREKLARQIQISDPKSWLEQVASAALGSAARLVTITPWQKNGATAVIGLCQDGRRLVFSPMPRKRFLELLKVKSKGALSSVEVGLLGDHPQRVPASELSIVNAGMFFDIEAGQAWQMLTGEPLPAPRLMMYEVPSHGSAKR